MPHIAWVEEDAAHGDVATIYQAWKAANPQREHIPEILKCFSARPDFLKSIIDISYSLHFADGFLDRRTKEMIATLVSALNQCPY